VIALPVEPPFVYTQDVACGRRQVFSQAVSPLGFRVNALTRHRLQPTFSGDVGFMFSTQSVPIETVDSFNFVFSFGAGFEFYRSHRSSLRLEYVVQHFGNLGTGILNPGVDSGFAKLTFSLGR